MDQKQPIEVRDMINSDLEADRGRVLAVIDQETAAISKGDRSAYFEILADDAVFMPPNIEEKRGDELRRWLDDFLQTTTVQYLNFVHVETLVTDDLACLTFACSWRAAAKAGGEPKVFHFKGIHVLRRRRDGVWKIVREIWNANPVTSA